MREVPVAKKTAAGVSPLRQIDVSCGGRLFKIIIPEIKHAVFIGEIAWAFLLLIFLDIFLIGIAKIVVVLILVIILFFLVIIIGIIIIVIIVIIFIIKAVIICGGAIKGLGAGERNDAIVALLAVIVRN